MSNERKNFTDTFVYRLLWGIWFLTFGFGVYLTWSAYLSQNHYLKIEAIQVDFGQKTKYTIGGLILEKNNNEPAAPGNDCTDSASSESDIILPTRLVPGKIGELHYANGKLRLELNNCIDYDSENDKLVSRVAYPKIYSGGKRIRDKNVSQEVLFEGLTIGYALKENQRVEIRFEPLVDKKFKLVITPRPNHLQYVFRDEQLVATKKINFIYGKKLSYEDIDDCDRSEVVVFHHNSVEPQRRTISISKESATIGKDEFTGAYLLDGQIYLNYSPREGLGIPLTYTFVTLVFFIFFTVIPLYKLGGERKSYRDMTRSTQRSSTFIFLFIPILALAVFYNVGSILLAHYYFHFERYDYFFPGDLGINYVTTGIVLLLFFLSLKVRFYLGDLLDWISEFIKDLAPFGFLCLAVLSGAALFVLWLFSDDQRALGFIPSHALVRFITILFYFFAGIFFLKRDGWKMLATLVILCALCVATGDTGFAFLSVGTFFFIVGFNHTLKTRHKIFFFLLPVLIVMAAFQFVASDYQRERIKLAYTDYTELQSENSSSIENANKESTDKQRIILQEAFNSNLMGHWSELRIPPEFKTVIWSDYILLYAFLYFGGLWMIALVVIPLLILIIYLFVIGKVFYHDLPKNGKYSNKRIALSSITGFVLFSYATQMLYMLLAMFRLVPLTGQSIPFLSLSRFENFFILSFIGLTFIVIFSLVLKDNDEEEQHDKPQLNLDTDKEKDKDFGYVELKADFLDEFSGWKFLLLSLAIIVVCAVGWARNSIPEYDSSASYSYRNRQKEEIFKKVLAKLSPAVRDEPEEADAEEAEAEAEESEASLPPTNAERNSNGNSAGSNININTIVANTDSKKLVEYFDEAINEVTNRGWIEKKWDYWKNRSVKNADIFQVELAKLYYGRESKLKIKDGEIVYQDSKPAVKANKFIARLSYKQKQGFDKKLNDRKLKVVRNGADFYINFNSDVVRPATLANIYTDRTFDGGEVLLDENTAIYTKRIDGEDRLQFCRGDLYGTLPVSIVDSESLKI